MDSLLDDLIGPIGPVSAPLSGKSKRSRAAAPDAPAAGSDGVISEGALADLLGLSTRRVRAMVDEGILERLAPGQYALGEVRKYCNFLREGVARRAGQGDELKIEKTRQARAGAEKLELQNAALRRDLLPRAEVERAWSDVLRDVRAQILAVPSRCGAALPHFTAHDVSTIEAEIRAALESIAHDS